jgi:membrane protease YdiL (CAAX protease family)
LQTPQDEFSDTPALETPPQEAMRSSPASIAPVWHTALLVAFIFAVSFVGVYRHTGAQAGMSSNRLVTYSVTAALELVMVGWVALGLRLRKIPLRSLFGSIPSGARSLALDLVIALAFWIGSLMVLATAAVMWIGVETAVKHWHEPNRTGKIFTPDKSQQKAATRAVVQLAPANGREIAGWVLLCLLVGVAEELVFRGYLQRQFTAWGNGIAAVGVVFSAIAFGAAHGYEGARSMFLLAIYGALFSLLALFRRSLRAGIFAHSWHDLIAGLTIAFLHSRHLL